MDGWIEGILLILVLVVGYLAARFWLGKCEERERREEGEQHIKLLVKEFSMCVFTGLKAIAHTYHLEIKNLEYTSPRQKEFRYGWDVVVFDREVGDVARIHYTWSKDASPLRFVKATKGVAQESAWAVQNLNEVIQRAKAHIMNIYKLEPSSGPEQI